MIPQFKYYFGPFLDILNKKGCCRLYDLNLYIANALELTYEERRETTKSGKITKHSSRVNYCASYLKRMKLVESFSQGLYSISKNGQKVLIEFGKNLTLTDLRNLPEFIATQINAKNEDFVYVKPHTRGGKQISGYVCNKNNLNKRNPNIENDVTERFRQTLKKE